jgi:hypothetical protein
MVHTLVWLKLLYIGVLDWDIHVTREFCVARIL